VATAWLLRTDQTLMLRRTDDDRGGQRTAQTVITGDLFTCRSRYCQRSSA